MTDRKGKKMNTTIENVKKINSYGIEYMEVKYLSGIRKSSLTSFLPKTVYEFMHKAEYIATYHDINGQWHEEIYSSVPINHF